MITVSIAINGEPIAARSAKNTTIQNDQGQTKYITDAGDVIWHNQSDRAVVLAKKMLDTIQTDMDKERS